MDWAPLCRWEGVISVVGGEKGEFSALGWHFAALWAASKRLKRGWVDDPTLQYSIVPWGYLRNSSVSGYHHLWGLALC